MTVNEFFIDFRTDRNVGIPVLIRKTKQLCVKNVFAIPYYDIAKYISNALGSPNQANIKSYSQRLKSVITDSSIQSLYSVEAVLRYHKKNVDECKDYWVGWFNPYSNKFDSITDIYGQTALWTQKSVDEALLMYEEKYFSFDKRYFFSTDRKPGSRYHSYANENSLKLLNFTDKFRKEVLKKALSIFLNVFLDDSKISEAVILETIYKHVSMAYSGYSVDGLIRFHRKQLVWNLFRDNSVLMFRKLLEDFNVNSDEFLGDKIFKNHFRDNRLGDKKMQYTEQLYRCLCMCISYLSIGVDLKKRVDENCLLGISWQTIHGYCEDVFNTAIPGEVDDAVTLLIDSCFHSYNRNGIISGFIIYLIALYQKSIYLCYDSNIMGYYCEADIGLKDKVKLEKYVSI